MNTPSTTRNDLHQSQAPASKRANGAGSRVAPLRAGQDIDTKDVAWQFLKELKRRKVFRAAGTYVVSAWLSAQVVDLVCDGLAAPSWILQSYLAALLFGFPIFLVLAWAFEYTTKGLRLDSVARSANTKSYERRRIDLAIIAVLIATIVLLIFLGQPAANDVAMSVTVQDEGLF